MEVIQTAHRTDKANFYYATGELMAEKEYKNGKENGLTTIYHKNGQQEKKKNNF
jgi:antitoxin component YwqK of YwqJK toxin-antitoxin module